MRTHGRKFSKKMLGQRLNIDRFKYQKNYKLNKKLKWYTLTETTITTTAVTKACIIKNATSLLAVTFNNNYPSNFWWYCVQSMYINDDRDCQGGGGGGGGQEWSHRGVIPWAGCEYHNSTLIYSTVPMWSIRTRQLQRLKYQQKPLVSSPAWSYIRRNSMHCLTPWGKFFKFNCVQLGDPHLIGGFSSLRVQLLG